MSISLEYSRYAYKSNFLYKAYQKSGKFMEYAIIKK